MEKELNRALQEGLIGDQATVFETAADLFSVLALAAIFAAIVYGATLVPSETAPLTKPEYGDRAGAAIPETQLRITLQRRTEGSDYVVLIQLGSRLLAPQSVSLSGINSGSALDELIGRIHDLGQLGEEFTEILCVLLRPQPKDSRLDGFFLDLSSGLKKEGFDELKIAIQ